MIQRLKWAAGANPALAQTLQLYEEALGTEQTSVEVRGVARLQMAVLRTFTISMLLLTERFLPRTSVARGALQ